MLKKNSNNWANPIEVVATPIAIRLQLSMFAQNL